MKRKDTGRLKVELAIAGVAGLVCAFLFKPEMMSRIDETQDIILFAQVHNSFPRHDDTIAEITSDKQPCLLMKKLTLGD